MTDVLTTRQRSYCMSQIRAKNTKPERVLRQILSTRGIRGFKINYPLLGKPDIVFPKKKAAIFIDGCFWHKCPKCFIKPGTNRRFWLKKINANIRRDRFINSALSKKGWRVIRIWEHDIKKRKNSTAKIINMIKG